MPHEFSTSYLNDALAMPRYYKNLAESALALVHDDRLAANLDSDLSRTISMRGEPHWAMQAIGPQLSDNSHVGQIVMVAKHFQSGSWKSLTVPRGRAEEVDCGMMALHASRK